MLPHNIQLYLVHHMWVLWSFLLPVIMLVAGLTGYVDKLDRWLNKHSKGDTDTSALIIGPLVLVAIMCVGGGIALLIFT